jgi:magnesium chelatase subunit D
MIPDFPFAALVALDELRLALRLAAIDRRLSVLLRGDKGAGKTTAARGLRELMPGAGIGIGSASGIVGRTVVDGPSADSARGDDDAVCGVDGFAGRDSEIAPFVNLPIGATEDRILGGLDIARAMNGEPVLKPGLLAAAHGGILYIDEVNLLPDHLADAMLDAVASGVHVVEREGISARQDADFVLIGSMNPEEGTLRPQLLDRFALVVDVAAPLDPADRRIAVERRLAFDRDPVAFAEAWRAHQDALAADVRRARNALAAVVVDTELLDLISQQVCAYGVRSLRADLAIVRASRALAALEGVAAVTADHVARVLPLALRHRASHASRLPEAPPPPSTANADGTTSADANGSAHGDRDRNLSARSGGNDSGAQLDDAPRRPADDAGDGDTGSPRERVFAPLPIDMPRIVVPGRSDASAAVPASRATAATAAAASASAGAPLARGPAIGGRQTDEPRELDVRATIVHAIGQAGALGQPGALGQTSAIGQGGSIRPRRDDLHEVVRKPTGRRRYLFAIDASGSQAAQQRMRLVKGAVEGLLGSSVRRGDEVAIVTFRGPEAEIALQPTSDANTARQALQYLPTGGRTPLAHALDLAAGLVTDDTVFILLTDGRANVALHSDDPWTDALDAASRVACPALVIDSESGPNAAGRAREIAARMRAMYQPLSALDGHVLIDLVRPM